MAQGFVWGIYVADDDSAWALRVNATYFSHTERGWDDATGTGLDPLPRQWVPRKVIGLDQNGHPQTAVSPRTDTLLWTGQSSSFSILGNDGSTILCSVIGRLAENTRARP